MILLGLIIVISAMVNQDTRAVIVAMRLGYKCFGYRRN